MELGQLFRNWVNRSGDVVLNNLYIKGSALDDLDLPIKVLHGNLGKLTLKIPWKNLYGAPTIASLEGLYLVAVPNAGIQYNEEKEQQAQWEAKQKELTRIEEAKKVEAEKNKPKDPKADSFAEKLATNVIKNLQIHISDIHIRYEDAFTNPKKPFALGITLKQLAFQTTDSDWNPKVIKEDVKLIHKLVELDSLAVYWNSCTDSYLGFDKAKMLDVLHSNIANPHNATKYKYLIEPIASSAHLRLHTKPESDNFSLPKILLNLVMEEIAIALNKNQYQDIMEMLEGMERMNLANIFRKYKPNVPHKGHARQWWLFAYNAILGETVRRRRRMWSWQHIKQHRDTCRRYKEAYKKKLTAKKVSKDLQETLDSCEKQLSVFNITMVRQHAEVEVMRIVKPTIYWYAWLMAVALWCYIINFIMWQPSSKEMKKLRKEAKKREKEAAKKQKKEKKEKPKMAKKEGLKKEKEGGGGWFGGWLGGGAKKEKKSGEKSIASFDDLMTAEEKAKMYAAIGYQENAADPTLPKEFVANEVHFELGTISLTLKDLERHDPQVMKLMLSKLKSDIFQRPSANAVNVRASIFSMGIQGTAIQPEVKTPMLLSTIAEEMPLPLLDLMFETNPLDGECDTRVNLSTRSIEIVYDAQTINLIANFFKPPEIQAAAMEKMEDIKEQTTAGLQYAIEQRKYTEITVNLMPTHIIVPEKGVLKKDSKFIVLDLGELNISTEKKAKQIAHANVAENGNFSHCGKVPRLSFDDLLQKAFDKFMIRQKNIQLMLVNPGDDWKAARSAGKSHMHILHPLSINVDLEKCMVPDNRIAKMRVSGELPALNISISDQHIKEITALALSIPLPEPDHSGSPVDEIELDAPDISCLASEGNAEQLVRRLPTGDESGYDSSSDEDGGVREKVKDGTEALFHNATDLELKFEVKQIALTINKQVKDRPLPILKLVVDALGTEVKVRSFDLWVSAYLGGIYLQNMQFKVPEVVQNWQQKQGVVCREESGGPLVNLINTPITDDKAFKLLKIEIVQANKTGPEFSTRYENIAQKISVKFSALEVLLHKEAILNILDFVKSMQPVPSSEPVAPPVEAPPTTAPSSSLDASKLFSKNKKQQAEVIHLALEANLDIVSVAICTADLLITDIKIKGLEANVCMQKSKIAVSTSLRDVTIYDTTPGALYPKILAFDGGEVFCAKIDIFNRGTDGDNYSDMNCCDTSVFLKTGCMKLVFLNKFVMSVVDQLRVLLPFQGFSDALLSEAAKNQIAEASSAVAESAVEAAQEVGKKAPRIKLDINLKAPVIIVPQKSTSDNALVVDLGHLSVKNRFSIPGQKMTNDGLPAVLDHMVVKLQALKLSRALMSSLDMKAECLLLEPVSIQVEITRNLASAWYHGHPDVEIGGKLQCFSVRLSQGDFRTIMSLLNENLQEGQLPKKPVAPPIEAPKPTDTAPSVEEVVKAEVVTSEVKEDPLKKKEEPYSNLKFDFTIESVRLELFIGDSGLSAGFVGRDPKLSLALLEMNIIGLTGNMRSDSSIEAHVLLNKCSLDDQRPGHEEGITRGNVLRVVENASHRSQQGGPPNMIDVIFVQNAQEDKDIDVKLCGLFICVCPEYLSTLGDFFAKGMPETPVVDEAPVVGATPATPPPPVPKGSMNLKFKMEKPEIMMIENPLNVDTNALVLDIVIDFKMLISPEIQTMQGAISGLQVVSCIYAPEKREASKSQILNPIDINLHSSAPKGKGHHMDIMVTDIIMNISPATIRTITATLSTMTPPETTTVDDSLQKIPKNLWAVKRLKDCEFWFLKTELAEEATENQQLMDEANQNLKAIEGEETASVESRGEQLLMSINKIIIKMEGGVGKRTLPFIVAEMSFKGEVKDWTSKLFVEADLSLEVAYFNEHLAVWEPLLEPVEDSGTHRSWEIKASVQQNDIFAAEDLLEETDDSKPLLPQPKMTISVISKDMLDVTMTKTCLEVLGNLGQSFNDAYMLVEPMEKPGEVIAPYKVQNDSGLYIKLKLDESFKAPEQLVNGHIELENGEGVPLYDAVVPKSTKLKRKASVLRKTEEDTAKLMYLVLEDFGATRELKVLRAETRSFGINQRAYPGGTWQLVAHTQAAYGCKTITLRSVLQVKNHLSFPMELYYKLSDDAMGRCGEVAPDQKFNVPCEAVYAAPYEIYFKPRNAKYLESQSAFNWKEKDSQSAIVSCPPAKSEQAQPIFFTCFVEKEMILTESTGQKNTETYVLNILPPVVFRNLLQMPVSIALEGSLGEERVDVEEGDKKVLYNANVGKSFLEVKILNYLNKEWVGRKLLETDPEEMSIWSFTAKDENGTESHLDLGVHTSSTKGYQEVELYCPYWMINKTGREITYRAGDDFTVSHSGDFHGAVLFSFRSKSFFGKKKDKADIEEDTRSVSSSKTGSLRRGSGSLRKKEKKAKKESLKKTIKASLKISESEWSDKFSLDTVGSAGTVSCKQKGHNLDTIGGLMGSSLHMETSEHHQNNNYVPTDHHRKSIRMKVGVKITLASTGLTKICTFSPYYIITNKAKYTICCRENIPESVWVDVAPGDCVPFWPVQANKTMTMVCKIKDTDEETKPFTFTESHTTLLRLNHEYGGINVETQVMESAVHIQLDQYKEGFAAVLLVNHTSKANITFGQKEVKEERMTLYPGETLLYTWQDALAKRELIWEAGEQRNQKDDLVKDGIGDFLYDSDTKLYWVSFLDGLQRVLMFTEDIVLATMAQQAGELERVEQEIILSLQGIGMSLVNNELRKEIAYLGISSSGVIWEEKKKKRFKALKGRTSLAIEHAWNSYQEQSAIGKKIPPCIEINPKLIVQFGAESFMVKPHKCPIRRNFENGIWIQYRVSPHQTQLHVKVHRLQLDNQLPGAVFPTVLAPLPPPKSVAAESVPKPFTELSVMIRKREFTSVMQFKYAKVLIQEFAVKVDQGFINALILMFASGEVDEQAQKTAFKADCDMINVDLMSETAQSSASEQKNYYDMLHFSPLKIHLSFSLHGSSGDEEQKKPTQLKSNVLNLFLQSVGIVLTDIQDVIFKLAYFERNYNFLNQSQLQGEIVRHYSSQAIKQMYVLVLGLDVLGNPFGVIRGVAQGIEDLFYEPYQGAIQGPEEFAEGLALGVRSLFGHAVGGAAGAVSRITGALGKGLATLTLDDDYQKKRREQMNKRPADFKEGLARGGKGLVMGVVDGVTGIVRKPVEGAKQDGAAGFFKGVGKGLVGAFTRPASGVVDFASSSFEGIRRAAEMSDEVHRQRPPRFIHKDGIIRAYSFQEAEGNDILQDTEKGKFGNSDQYLGYLYVTPDRKNILMVTDRRVMFVSKGEVFGHWDCDWMYMWEDLKEPPSVISGGIQILLKEKQKKSFFSSGTVGKKVSIPDQKAAEWLVAKMKGGMLSNENK
ncbi:hypothetical protein CAPTEDRAFT_224867 [Capitella teleta]|uniref:Vacuolar protein sorting-associated protein 13C n=1 Tax=Capitella teleta TaxID=283909 RepID=R7VFD3_CAPTE|nr:hypothetical protein CAPTEDRAFT_224867 [Capitella teleta]|eukprot:ELU14385.1 hypothetical protein CAPTEDRAFT_224867 [Capitella teleta]